MVVLEAEVYRAEVAEVGVERPVDGEEIVADVEEGVARVVVRTSFWNRTGILVSSSLKAKSIFLSQKISYQVIQSTERSAYPLREA